MTEQLVPDARRRAADPRHSGTGDHGAGDRADRHWAPARWQLLLAGVLLSLLWAVVLSGLGAVFELHGWIWRAIAISTATAMVGSAARAIRPPLRASAALVGILAGALCWLMWFSASGRAQQWFRDPVAMLIELWTRIDRGAAPLDPSGALEDLVLLVVLLASGVSVLLLVGLGHPLAAGAFAALLLLTPAGVTGFSAGWLPILTTGALLALLAWLGSPAPSWAGVIAAGAAVALAAGAVAVAPPTRDRVWNSGVMLGPLSTTVPDVTIALADDLRRHSETRAFTFTGGVAGSQRFTLATLSSFAGGRWSPQSTADPDELTVKIPRSPSTVPPRVLSEEYSPQMNPVTITIEGLLSSWLPLPQSTMQVTDRDGGGGFDPQQWLWNADSSTARSERAVTRPGYTYRADALPLLASRLPSEMWSGTPAFLLENGTGGTDYAVDSPLGEPICTITIDSDGTRTEQGDCSASSGCADSFEPVDPQTGEQIQGTCVDYGPSDAGSRAAEPAMIPGSELLPDPSAAPAELAPYLELPSGMPEELLATAKRIADGADDRLTLGMRLQDWLRENFSYDEAAPYEPGADPSDPYAVMTALLKQKRGFCVHFASTFAVMARALGAPTRIAVGYAASSRRTGEETIVRGKDLHAWPEIYFDDQGWVAFEPTPGGAGLRADEGRDVPRTPPSTPTTEPTRTSAPPSQRPTKSPERPDTDPAKNPTTTSGDGIDPATIVLWSLPLLAVILLLLPAGWRLRRRQRRVRAIARGDAPAQRAWAEFSDTLADLGLLGSAPGDGGGGGDAERGSENPSAPRARTPEATLEHLEALGVLTGQPAAAARELASAMAAERYGDGAADAVATARLLELARGGLLAGATSGVRARAALAPRSLLRRAPH